MRVDYAEHGRMLPVEATPDLVFGHLRLEGILLLVQVDLLGHPRERIVSPVLFR